MNKIFEDGFWKGRLRAAEQVDQIWKSIYLCNEESWKTIEREHEKIFKKEIPEDANVLDAGCGYGRLAPLFKNYIGVDMSKSLLDIAGKRNAGKWFIEADLRRLPFVDGRFDVAICSSIRKMVVDNEGQEEWDKMQKELKRVAGKVIIVDYQKPTEYEIL